MAVDRQATHMIICSVKSKRLINPIFSGLLNHLGKMPVLAFSPNAIQIGRSMQKLNRTPLSTIDYYKKNAEDLARRYESAGVKELQTLLKSCFVPGAKLLEMGCGSGRDAAFMLANGFDITAVDGASEMVESAVRYHPELAGRVHTIHLPKELSEGFGSFDGLFSIATLMHLTRQAIDEVFKKAGALLGKKGRFFFSVPSRRDDVNTGEFDEKGRRFTAMSVEEWISVSQSAGFEVVKTSITRDGLGREGIVWLNCLVEKSNPVPP